MSEIDLKQKFMVDCQYRATLQIPNTISATLDYCEYSIFVDFCAADKSKFKNKNRKR
jgi:hypothetical protein